MKTLFIKKFAVQRLSQKLRILRQFAFDVKIAVLTISLGKKRLICCVENFKKKEMNKLKNKCVNKIYKNQMIVCKRKVLLLLV